MRNWNFLLASQVIESTELPDYLWGIETQRLNPVHEGSRSFQTTYEELKPPERRAARYRCISFQTTYEELKPPAPSRLPATVPASRLPMRNWNILPLAVPSKRLNIASRLPMRNWNLTSSSMNSSKSSCFQTTYEELKLHLWRLAAWCSSRSLPDYLWGIETHRCTYRLDFHIQLPDYLWGIETRWNIPATLRPCTLPDYLWGIETKLNR